MSSHGGARRGAGRPRKWSFDDVLKIGQACEIRWRSASEEALNARLAALPNEDKIQELWRKVQSVPVSKRKAWCRSDEFEEYLGDQESWLHNRAGTPFDEEQGTFAGEAPRIFTLSTKPSKGSRHRIIREMAAKFELSENQVDNLWQAYRRFEGQLRDAPET